MFHKELVVGAAVAQRLTAAGTEVVTVLSRADLLAPHVRETLLSYLQTRLPAHLGIAPPIWPVSVNGAERKLKLRLSLEQFKQRWRRADVYPNQPHSRP